MILQIYNFQPNMPGCKSTIKCSAWKIFISCYMDCMRICGFCACVWWRVYVPISISVHDSLRMYLTVHIRVTKCSNSQYIMCACVCVPTTSHISVTHCHSGWSWCMGSCECVCVCILYVVSFIFYSKVNWKLVKIKSIAVLAATLLKDKEPAHRRVYHSNCVPVRNGNSTLPIDWLNCWLFMVFTICVLPYRQHYTIPFIQPGRSIWKCAFYVATCTSTVCTYFN